MQAIPKKVNWLSECFILIFSLSGRLDEIVIILVMTKKNLELVKITKV